MRQRHGFTLVETLMVVVVIGLVTAIGLPRMRSSIAQVHMSSARNRVVTLYATARSTAVGSSRRAAVMVSGNTAYVVASPRRNAGTGTVDTVGQIQNFKDQYGVNLQTTVSELWVAPTGLGMTEGTLTLKKGDRSVNVTITRYGGVRR